MKYPKRVQPLFRNETDLPAGLLGESIRKELEGSHFLLVICSPSSAQSEWVNQEVENFILMGRYEQIIPYIIEGTPNSGDPSTERFPPILRKNREYISYSHLSPEENAKRQSELNALLDNNQNELKEIYLSDESIRVSRLKVISRMLEVRPETLIQQDKLRQKKRIFWSSVTALFFMSFLTGLGFWIWDRYFQVHTGYFADYVEYWGVPKGIFPLKPEQWALRSGHYRIYTQNRKVIKLEHVNFAGVPIPVTNAEYNDCPMIAVYPIYKDGRLFQRDTLDNNGKVIMSYLYTDDEMQKVEFRSFASDDASSSTVITNVTSLTKNLLDSTQEGKRGKIDCMHLDRDSEGRVIEERFMKGMYDVSTTDEQGIAGFQYKLDVYGRVVEKIYLGQDGNPHPDKKGVACQTCQYDKDGNLYEIKYLDQNGELIPNELGWMHSVRTFDKNMNIVKEKRFDSSGDIDIVFDYKYDEFGHKIETAYFGVDGKPCLHKKGYARVTKQYDENGEMINETYYDLDGNPVRLRKYG